MSEVPSGRVRGRVLAVRAWPIWGLPRWLVSYVILVTLFYAAAIAVIMFAWSYGMGRLLMNWLAEK